MRMAPRIRCAPPAERPPAQRATAAAAGDRGAARQGPGDRRPAGASARARRWGAAGARSSRASPPARRVISSRRAPDRRPGTGGSRTWRSARAADDSGAPASSRRPAQWRPVWPCQLFYSWAFFARQVTLDFAAEGRLRLTGRAARGRRPGRSEGHADRKHNGRGIPAEIEQVGGEIKPLVGEAQQRSRLDLEIALVD